MLLAAMNNWKDLHPSLCGVNSHCPSAAGTKNGMARSGTRTFVYFARRGAKDIKAIYRFALQHFRVFMRATFGAHLHFFWRFPSTIDIRLLLERAGAARSEFACERSGFVAKIRTHAASTTVSTPELPGLDGRPSTPRDQ